MNDRILETVSNLMKTISFPYEIVALVMNYSYPRCPCKMWICHDHHDSAFNSSDFINLTFCSDSCHLAYLSSVKNNKPVCSTITRQISPDNSDDALLSSYYDSYGWNITSGNSYLYYDDDGILSCGGNTCLVYST